MPNLADLNSCTGCTACESACPKGSISMLSDEYGFCYPKVDTEACVNCGFCEKVCPVVTLENNIKNSPKAYAAYSKDEEMRLKSSSGGVFTELSRSILAQGGAVFGASYDADFQVVHICAEDEKTLSLLRGAKYSQSKLGDTFSRVKKMLDSGRKVLFSGTPCCVTGLNSFLGKDYENLITVDFVCHSVPSPMAWREYVCFRAEKDNNGSLPLAINLRAKDTGWSRYRYSNRFDYPDGTVHLDTNADSLYMKLFGGGYISRQSCENCHFKGYSRTSDMTIGDFWGIWDIAPDMDDNRGTSVLICQSERGEEILKSIGDKLVIKQVSLEEASRQNTAILYSSPSNSKRTEAFELIRSGRISECARWFEQPKPTLKQKIYSIAKRILKK